MADYDGVGWRSIAGDPWFLRSTGGVDDHGEYEAGCWLGLHHHWDQGLALYTSHCNMCQSSYLCSTNVAKAAPSPAPTTAAPTVTAVPTIVGLALVIDGSKDTFHYDSPLWTNDQLYDDDGELKARPFFEPTRRFTVVMEYGFEERSLFIELDEAKSLQDLFAGGYTATDANVDEWRALVPDAGYENNCNRQGFNTESDGCSVGMSHCRLRLGIWFNEDEPGCGSSDSFLGIGAAEF